MVWWVILLLNWIESLICLSNFGHQLHLISYKLLWFSFKTFKVSLSTESKKIFRKPLRNPSSPISQLPHKRSHSNFSAFKVRKFGSTFSPSIFPTFDCTHRNFARLKNDYYQQNSCAYFLGEEYPTQQTKHRRILLNNMNNLFPLLKSWMVIVDLGVSWA